MSGVHGLNKVHVMALNVTPLLSTKLPYEGGCSGWCGLFALLILIQMQSREYCAKRSWHGKNSGAIISVHDYALAVPILSASLKQV